MNQKTKNKKTKKKPPALFLPLLDLEPSKVVFFSLSKEKGESKGEKWYIYIYAERHVLVEDFCVGNSCLRIEVCYDVM